MNPSLKATLVEDLAVNWHYRGRNARPRTWTDVARSIGDVRFLPVLLVRVARAGYLRQGFFAKLAMFVALINRLVFGVECALQAQIGPGLYFPHAGGIVIGAQEIGANCVIYHQVTLGAKTMDMNFTKGARPRIGDNVVIAAGAKVLGGVVIGRDAIIGANAVVVSDVAAGQTVGGVPARLLRAED